VKLKAPDPSIDGLIAIGLQDWDWAELQYSQ